ncbi:uncharacterized protein LOC141714595 [Apium graveolens]|uniref:uncharacterized protein LOC141714595 n=1 Tax=Apium graveolens TaxID=4045 RepID=UPI003D7B5B3C
MSQLANTICEREKNKFPSQPEVNPKFPVNQRPHDVNTVISLRSGNQLRNRVGIDNEEENSSSKPNPSPLSPSLDHSKQPENFECSETPHSIAPPLKPSPNLSNERVFTPKASYPQRLISNKQSAQVDKILEVFKQVKVNIPLLDAIQQIPSYAKFPKELCNTFVDKALLDLGASVNLLLYSVYQELGLGELQKTNVTLQLADRSIKIPKGIIEDVLIKVGDFVFPVDFVVLETEPVKNPKNQIPVILGRPFPATSNALINCRNGLMKLTFGNMTIDLNIFHVGNQPNDYFDQHMEINLIDKMLDHETMSVDDALDFCLNHFGQNWVDSYYTNEVDGMLESTIPITNQELEPLPLSLYQASEPVDPSPPELELKPLPNTLKYMFLGPNESFPVIIASNLTTSQEEELLSVLRENKEAIGWSISDIKGISPAIVQHRIHLVDDVKPVREPQRRLNPTLMEVVRKEILKCLDNGIIFPISDSSWVSPIQVVLKKSGINVVTNENDEQVSTRVQSGWREKCHFMVKEGIVLGHKISKKGIEVDKAKIDLIASLPPPKSVKAIRSFLGHAGFYRRFIKDFSKKARPLTNLLSKDVKFEFNSDCLQSFEHLKKELTSSPIIKSPDWNEPFELMCDASDYLVGAVLGQRINKIPHVMLGIYVH